MKKIIILIISVISGLVEAGRPLMSGDIVGRELNQWPLGWAGHVGIGTGDDVGRPTQLIIEALNEAPLPVVQFNSLANFMSRTKYWGSRYGIGDYSTGTYNALVEANRQGWWCPSYTSSTAYVIGAGNIYNKVPSKCSVWRCDTFVAWAFYSARFPQLMNIKIMLPLNVWNTFPYFNGDALVQETSPPKLPSIDKEFSDLTVEELNNLDYPKFAEIADIPIQDETPAHLTKEWEFAENESVVDVKRGIFLDRLAIVEEQNTISKLLDIYNKTKNNEVRSKIIQALQTNYQNQNASISAQEKENLKFFYDDLLQKQLRSIDIDKIVRGYIDINNAHKILKMRSKIEAQITQTEERMALGLRLDMANKSQELQKIYMPIIVENLKKANRSDLDDMFFGITSIRIKTFTTKSIKVIKEYTRIRKNKYASAIMSSNDPSARMAKISLEDLNKSLRIRGAKRNSSIFPSTYNHA
ncbi:MAG: hypothetical protein H0U75_03715 [Legionella sp.]|nr:hypothetical protein [Legionella sp.]